MLKTSGTDGTTHIKTEMIENMSKEELDSSLCPFSLTFIHFLHWKRMRIKIHFSLFFKFYLFILREREREQAGEGQRERIPSRLCTVSIKPKAGLDLTNHEIMT